MTTNTETIEVLELQLVVKTRECSCFYEINKIKDDSLACGMCWTGKKHDQDCEVEWCLGTGVVPLVAEWRLMNSWRTGCPKMGCMTLRSGLPCDRCKGLGCVPDLDGMKVLAWMHEQSGALISTQVSPKGIEAIWHLYPRVEAYGATPEEAIYRAALAGIEAMDNEATQ